MDWSHVTVGELLDALQEVDWNLKPRPLGEFFAKFTPPNWKRLESRIKCNAYYYRTNYLILVAGGLALPFVRNPLALLALAVMLLAALCLNDTFAVGLSDKLLRLARRVHPRTALRLRSRTGAHPDLTSQRGRKAEVKIAGANRNLVAGALFVLGGFLIYRTNALLTLALGILLGLGSVSLHCCFRSPNLKTRFATAQSEFRAAWRGYQESGYHHDYTM